MQVVSHVHNPTRDQRLTFIKDEHPTVSRINISSNSNTFHKLPRKIRDIYKLCVAESWNGRTPAFIKALRGDQQLYDEVQKAFYKSSYPEAEEDSDDDGLEGMAKHVEDIVMIVPIPTGAAEDH